METLRLIVNKSKVKLFVVISLFLILLLSCKNNPVNKPEGLKENVSVTSSSEAGTGKSVDTVAPVFLPDSVQTLLKGKWLRSDGTYTIEIFSISGDGRMDAGYFNPNPINVGKSGWMITDKNIIIEIILKDVNYPGSKYNLMYDRKNNCLVGNYFQAVQGINYDVMFFRAK